MKTPHSTQYQYLPGTIEQANKLTPGTVSESDHKFGMQDGEPLIVIMDALTKYAASYYVRFETRLAEDYILGPLWLESAKGIRGLLNGDGALAMFKGRRTDSKDNGCLEAMFWEAMLMAGFEEKDI